MTDRVHQATNDSAQMRADRRYLHAHPEVGLDLPHTHEWVTDQLRALALEPETHPAAGVSVSFAGTSSSADQEPTVVLRVDMDALPVTERTNLPYASTRPGAMHACGHDLHTAVGLGVARTLAKHPPRSNTVLVFQPGEETDRGASAVLDAHQNLRFDSPGNAFAVHVHAQAPTGQILLRPGTFMAYGDWFTIQFTGTGGHASAPELTGNPIHAGSRFVDELNAATDQLNRTEHTVGTVTEFLAGNTVNVIPTTASLRGTIRTLSDTSRRQLIHQIDRIVHDSAAAARVEGTWTLHEGYPAVVNDIHQIVKAQERLESTTLKEQISPMESASMVIEDFSYFLHRWPGMMIYVGAHVLGCNSFSHADDVLFDEAALTTSLALYLLAADAWELDE